MMKEKKWWLRGGDFFEIRTAKFLFSPPFCSVQANNKRWKGRCHRLSRENMMWRAMIRIHSSQNAAEPMSWMWRKNKNSPDSLARGSFFVRNLNGVCCSQLFAHTVLTADTFWQEREDKPAWAIYFSWDRASESTKEKVWKLFDCRTRRTEAWLPYTRLELVTCLLAATVSVSYFWDVWPCCKILASAKSLSWNDHFGRCGSQTTTSASPVTSKGMAPLQFVDIDGLSRTIGLVEHHDHDFPRSDLGARHSRVPGRPDMKRM